ncbi:MAG: hypothetical protein RIS79_1192 [Verrucomicrobiota bacterium]|jgi:bifunctional DNA-binding transcriptional regulator/antitoxin component of YhaV-PrlF toxin-antitoxin module
MSAVISIDKRGTLTLPKQFWSRLGLFAEGEVVVEETARGVLLRSQPKKEAKVYSKAKLARIAKAEAALAPFESDLRASLARAKAQR